MKAKNELSNRTEVRTPVRVFRVGMVCPECGNGRMLLSSGAVLVTWPAQYTHKCNSCGYMTTYTKTYPYVEYEDAIYD